MQGHQLYYGPAQKVHMWFDQLGAPCPERVSIADFILDLASNDVVIGDRQVSSKSQRNSLVSVASSTTQHGLQQFPAAWFHVSGNSLLRVWPL